MVGKLYFVVVFAALMAFALQAEAACDGPKVDATSYTPSDIQVLTHVPFISEFTISCGGQARNDLVLYANVDGHFMQVARTSDGAKYQISWTKEVKDTKPGDYDINLYDEDGYSAVRRLDENGEDVAKVKPLAKVTVFYPGAYKGAFVSSELVASVIAAMVFYLAYSAKGKLLA